MPETVDATPIDPSVWGLKSRGVLLTIGQPDPDRVQITSIDVETDEKDNFVGIAFCQIPDRVYYSTHLGADERLILERNDLIGHNIKSDALWLRKWGVNIRPEQLVYDTMLASYVQDSTKQSHGLKELLFEIFKAEYPSYYEMTTFAPGVTTLDQHIQSLLNWEFDADRHWRRRSKDKKADVTLDKLPIALVANYCGSDAYFTYRLKEYFNKILSPEQNKYLEEIEIPTMHVIMEMEERGVQIDAAYLRTLDSRFNIEIQRLVEMVRRLAPSIENVNSDKQVGDFLISKGFTLPKTPKGKPSVSVKALEPFEGVPFIKTLKRYSELEKLVSTYTSTLIEESHNANTYRLHANFNQAITHTGRFSSSGPNLQNIPTRTSTGELVRNAFVAAPGCFLIDADYSQIEPRLFAHFSQDPELLKIFNEGHDLYDYVANAIGCTRAVAKTVWLALSYNAGPFKISQTAHIEYYTAVKFIDKMKQKFSTAFKWKEKIIRDTDSNKYVETILGAHRRLLEGSLGPNYKVQGSAAELMKLAIIKTGEFNPVLTVHDELLFECPNTEPLIFGAIDIIKRRMEGVIKLSVPLLVEIGTGESWQEAKG